LGRQVGAKKGGGVVYMKQVVIPRGQKDLMRQGGRCRFGAMVPAIDCQKKEGGTDSGPGGEQGGGGQTLRKKQKTKKNDRSLTTV